MASVSTERFAALARSSPWRWRTLRFTVEWRGDSASPVRAWVRRPGCLRVEAPDGALIFAGREERPGGGTVLLTSGGSSRDVEMISPLDPRAPRPEFGVDGLVSRRPRDWSLHFDDPMYINYRWVAMLDPAELSDGIQDETGDTTPDPVDITRLTEVDHHGRVAWQADLRPNPSYDPRCSCCPLLFSKASEDWEAEAGGPTLRERDPSLRYADAHRVRLDVATGVCVYTEELGGTHAGNGHDLRIEAVDELMHGALFADNAS
ncbi:MAG: hypothetical protein ACRDQ7_14510 [Haloechinothrix sp.]